MSKDIFKQVRNCKYSNLLPLWVFPSRVGTSNFSLKCTQDPVRMSSPYWEVTSSFNSVCLSVFSTTMDYLLQQTSSVKQEEATTTGRINCILSSFHFRNSSVLCYFNNVLSCKSRRHNCGQTSNLFPTKDCATYGNCWKCSSCLNILASIDLNTRMTTEDTVLRANMPNNTVDIHQSVVNVQRKKNV